jgi:hypothetical protein
VLGGGRRAGTGRIVTCLGVQLHRRAKWPGEQGGDERPHANPAREDLADVHGLT